MLQLMCEGCSYTYSPLSIAKYSFIEVNELEQYRVVKLAHIKANNMVACVAPYKIYGGTYSDILLL